MRRVDDGGEFLDPEHAHVGDGESAALEFIGFQFPGAGAGGEVAHFAADGQQSLLIGAAHDGRDQPIGDGDSDADIDIVIKHHAVIGPTGVDLGNTAQRGGGGLDDEIVDGEEIRSRLIARGGFRVQLLLDGDHRVEFDVHRDIEMRDARFGLGQAAGDHLAYRTVRHDPVRRADGRRGLSGGGRLDRRLGHRGGGAFLSRLDVRAHDASVGAAALHRRQIDPGLKRHPPRQRRREHPSPLLDVRGHGGHGGNCRGGRHHRSGSGRHRHGRRRRGGWAGGGGRRLRHGLAFFNQHGDRGIDLHALGAVLHEDAAKHARVHRLDLHRGLVSFDLGDHVARLDRIAFFFQPARQRALGHGRAEGGHQNVGGHDACSRSD